MTRYHWVAMILVTITTLPIHASDTLEPLDSQSAIQESETQELAVSDTRSDQAAGQALRIDLGPLPDEAQDGEDPNGLESNGHQIGVHRTLPDAFIGDLTPQLSWAVDANGQHTAAVTFSAEDAVSIRIAVDVSLPAGGSIQIFDGAGVARGSTFTRADFDSDTPVWLPSAEGDTLTVQIILPSAAAVEALSFTVTKVAHRFDMPVPQAEGIECSNHLDVACTTSQRVRDVAKTLARINYEKPGGTYVCSGTLLNVRRFDDDDPLEPYFLTANHCVANAEVAASVEAWWFYRHARCRSTSLDDRFAITFGGADLLAGTTEQDSTLLRFKQAVPRGVRYSGWDPRTVPLNSYVYAVHHPNGDTAGYSTGRFKHLWTGTIGGDDGFTVHNALRVDWARGTTEGGSSGAGLFRSDYLIGVHSAAAIACKDAAWAGSFRDFYPHIERWLDPANYRPVRLHHLPLLSPASHAPRIGVVRIVTVGDRGGTVAIYAIDDAGARFGPGEVELEGWEAIQFDSADVEALTGIGEGYWRLELSTTLNIRSQAFIRAPDGTLAPVHDVVPLADETDGFHLYHVKKFFPARHEQQSWLRLINPTADELEVIMVSVPDWGGELLDFADRNVSLTLEPHAARWLSATHLEEGDSGLRGSLGELRRGHYLLVRADKPLWVMNLVRTPEGQFVNLSTAVPAGK